MQRISSPPVQHYVSHRRSILALFLYPLRETLDWLSPSLLFRPIEAEARRYTMTFDRYVSQMLYTYY